MARTPIASTPQPVDPGGVQLQAPVGDRVNLSGIAREYEQPLTPVEGIVAAGRAQQQAAESVARFGQALTGYALQQAEIKNQRDVAQAVNEMVLGLSDAQDRMVGRDPSEWVSIANATLTERKEGFAASRSLSPAARSQIELEFGRFAARAQASVGGAARSQIQQEARAASLANIDYYYRTNDPVGAFAEVDRMGIPEGDKVMMRRKLDDQFRVRAVEMTVDDLIARAESGDHLSVLAEVDDPWMEGYTAQVTKYGYKDDPTQDPYSYRVAGPDDEYAKKFGLPPGTEYGVGDRGNLLQTGRNGGLDGVSIALSPADIDRLGLPAKSDGREILVQLPDGREFVGTWEDKTSREYEGRTSNAVDIYTPSGHLEIDGQQAVVRPAKYGLDRESLARIRKAAKIAANQARAETFSEVTELIAGGQVRTKRALEQVLSIRPDVTPSDRMRLEAAMAELSKPTQFNPVVFRRYLNEVMAFEFDPEDSDSVTKSIILQNGIERDFPDTAAALKAELKSLLNSKVQLGGVAAGPTTQAKAFAKQLIDAALEAERFGPPTIKRGVFGFRDEIPNMEAHAAYNQALYDVARELDARPDLAADMQGKVAPLVESIISGKALPDSPIGPDASLFPSEEEAIQQISNYSQDPPPMTDDEAFQRHLESDEFMVYSQADIERATRDLDPVAATAARRTWAVLSGAYTEHPDLHPMKIREQLKGMPLEQLPDFVRSKLYVDNERVLRRWTNEWRIINGQ